MRAISLLCLSILILPWSVAAQPPSPELGQSSPSQELGAPSPPRPSPPTAAEWLVAPLMEAAELDEAQGRHPHAIARAGVVAAALPQGAPMRVRAEALRLLATDRMGAGAAQPGAEEVIAPIVIEADMDLRRGRPDLAIARLDFALAYLPPGAPLTQRAIAMRDVAARMMGGAPPPPPPPPSAPHLQPRDVPVAPSNDGQRGTGEIIELYITLGAWGALTGGYLPFAVSDGTANSLPYIFSVAGGGAIGAVAVLMIDGLGEPLHTGVPPAISASLRFGLADGLCTLGMLANGGGDAVAAFSVVWGGMTLGGVVGTALALGVRPSVADVRFVEAGGWWGAALGSFAAMITNFDDTAVSFGLVLGSMNVGLLTNALIAATGATPSVGRTYLISAGFAGGAGLGALVPAILLSNTTITVDPLAFGVPMLVGSLIGFGLTFALTEGFDARNAAPPPITPTLIPLDRGLALGVSGML